MRKIKPEKLKDEFDGPKSMEKLVYPEFKIKLKHLPEAKDWEVGENYTLKLHIKQTGLNMDKFRNDATFEIRGIEVVNNPHPAKKKKVKRY